MQFHYVKISLKAAVFVTFVLLLGVSLAVAQQKVGLSAGPTTATLPDGTLVSMWGYTCSNVAGSLATCAPLNPAAAVTPTTWSPVVITVPAGLDLEVDLTNNLSFLPTGATTPNNIPTSLMIVGQLGAGLGKTATVTPSPAHAAQGATWPIVSPPDTGGATAGNATFNPPPQGNRVQSFSTEVAVGAGAVALTWTAPRPGTYLLESGTHPSIQGPMGLYGILVVTDVPGAATGLTTGCAYGYTAANTAATPPTTASCQVPYSAEVPLIFSEIDPVQNNAVSTAVNTSGFTETAVWSGQPNQCGNPKSANYHTCYPPAVNYTPLYYLINGQPFNKTNASSSLFAATAGVDATTGLPLTTGITGPVLVRMVNAGVRMHVPSIVGSLTTPPIVASGTTAAAVPGFSLVAEDGNPLPGVSRVQSEVFMAAGKTYDVMIDVPATPTGATVPPSLPVYDRELSLSGNAIARDTGMLAYIGVNGAAIPSAPALTPATAYPDGYSVVCTATCNTLTVSDPGKGVLANDVNVFGAQVSVAPGKGTLTLAANGTFTYVPNSGWSGGDSFTYCGNGTISGTTGAACALVTLSAGPIEAAGGITVRPDSYSSSVATFMSIKSPGILANDTDGKGYPLTVDTTSVSALSGPGTATLSVDASGAFNVVEVSAPGTYTFTYKAKNSQGSVSTGSATVTLTFPAPSGLQVTVLDGADKKTVISDYRWLIEEDRTFYVNPRCTTNPPPAGCPGSGGGTIVPTFGTNFHTSYMPLIAAGCTGALSCESGQTLLGVPAVCDIGNGVCRTDAAQQTPVTPDRVALDPTKRYYLTIFPGDAGNPFANGYTSAPVCDPTGAPNTTCGHGMGGAPVACTLAAGEARCSATDVFPAITVYSQPSPYPPAKLSVFVFEDDFPLNGEQDGGGGIDVLSPNEPGLGGFNITLFDDAGGTGDATGQPTYDMFNMPLGNSLDGTLDPATGLNACPVTQQASGITGMIVTCPKYESDGKTLSPLAGQAVVANLYAGRYGVVATPAADRIARGEEWLQTNTLDGQKAHDSFLRIGEPSFFQEFGPAGYHVSIGFANPAIINARLAGVCNGTDPNITGPNCKNTVKGMVTTERMSRTPDERLYSSGDNTSFAFTQCYVSLGDPDGEDFAFTKCDANGNFTVSGLPDGDWRITIFDQWNDMLVDGLSTPVRLGSTVPTGQTTSNDAKCPGSGSSSTVCDMGQIAMNQWQANIYTTTFFDQNGNGVRDGNEPGLTLVSTNIRFRDGSYSNFNNTDLNGNAGFNEVFPLFSWYVVETDTTRYKNTGTHVVYDAGGPADGSPSCAGAGNAPCGTATGFQMMANTAEQAPVPAALRVPGARYCASADCPTGDTAGGSTGRVDPGWVWTEGWQGFSGQNSFIEFGKVPFADNETGGIHGEVIYASTRPFDDPTLLIHTSWTPDVPGVTINLYQEGTAPDGTQSLTLVDTTKTSSWDDWAQGFYPGTNKPYMSCPGQSPGPVAGSAAPSDLFFFTLYNQPMWLDAYANGSTPAHTIPNSSQFKCYDGMHNWNQLQPAPYDGMYQFPSIIARDSTSGVPVTPSGVVAGVPGKASSMVGTNCTICLPNPTNAREPMLPPGKYVVEMIVPPGYELVKEEDKNILIGDNYIAPVTQQFAGLGNIFILPDQAEVAASTAANCTPTATYACNSQQSTQSLGRTTYPSSEGDTGSVEVFWPCVGASRIVPDFISLFPQSGEVSPFAGATRNLCDRKEVQLSNANSVLAKFWIFTSTHVAAHFTGVITDDFTSEFDPFSPTFGEKFSPANLPVAIKDWTGTEISRVYTDQWGAYDGLTYSTWEVNPPNPTGYAPTMMVTCMNDPGTGSTPDQLFNPEYSQFCYEIPFMPGQTQYMDTPVVPTSAFAGAGYNNPDCDYPDQTPAVAEVDGDGVGPHVSAFGHPITITSLTAAGDVSVLNYGYSGPSATTAPFNAKSVTRHYGFGSGGTVTVGGVPLANVNWGDTTITGTVVQNGVDGNGNAVSVPQCAVQQQAPYGGSTAYCGQLVITRADNGKMSIDTVTVTIGGSAPKHVAASDSIQSAIDAANPGDLLMIDPTCTAAGLPVACTTAGATKSQAAHQEILLMWKPVRLQGVGASSSIINANTHPAGKMNDWRARVDCLFGIAPSGSPNGYDPTCGSGWNQFTGGVTTDPTTGATIISPQVDRLPLEATVGWDASLNGNLAELLQEPSLMGALEGAGITVLSKGVDFHGQDPFVASLLAGFPTGTTLLSQATCVDSNGNNPFPSSFWCNPSSIDGLSITDSSQGGGGVFVHGWGHNLQIANNRIYNNAGTLSGGINVGQGEYPTAYLVGSATNAAPGSCLPDTGLTPNVVLPYCMDMNVNVHHNYITRNSSNGDELFSATPAGAGGVSFCTGSDYYKFQYNWVCGNLSTGDGGGVGHLGFIYGGDIEHNTILFNQSTNPTIPSNGGGLIVMGTPDVDPPCGTQTDADCVPPLGTVGPSDGSGPGLIINANLIVGNAAESGSGGGLRLQHINGSDVISFPNSPQLWNSVKVTNNIITNNVAGWDGAGISLLDALNTDIVSNTIASNDTTASSGMLFDTIGAPLASSSGTNCKQNGPTGANTASCPQPAGLVSIQNSAVLQANLPASITCPAGHGNGGTGTGGLVNGHCRLYSVPILENDLFWQNRAFYIGVGSLGTGTLNQQHVVALYNAFTSNQVTSQPLTGACVTGTRYWDIGVRGDTGPSNHNGGLLTPRWSVLTSIAGYAGNNNTSNPPGFVSQYCNGSRVPPENGGVGYQVPPGISDATVPNPIFNLTPAATVDEGNNWINISWGPLSMTNPQAPDVLLGNYALQSSSPDVDYVACTTTSGGCQAAGEVDRAPTTDFFGNPRPDGVVVNRIDAGAIEFQNQATTSVGPALTSITPNTGLRGTVVHVVLTGTNLTGTTTVTVTPAAGIAVALTSVNANTVTANFTIAASAPTTARNVTVTVTGFPPSNAVTFTVLGPTLTSISPNTAVRGAGQVPVTFTGTNLSGATGITGLSGNVTLVGGSFHVVSSTSVTATLNVPSNAALGARNLGLTTTTNGATNTVTFTVQGATLTFSGPTPALTTTPANTSTKTGLATVTNAATATGAFTFTAAPTVVKNGTTGGTFSVIAGGSCTSATVLSPGASCTVNVQYAPGTSTATASAHVTVTGTGLATASQNSSNFNAN